MGADKDKKTIRALQKQVDDLTGALTLLHRRRDEQERRAETAETFAKSESELRVRSQKRADELSATVSRQRITIDRLERALDTIARSAQNIANDATLVSRHDQASR